MKKWMVVLASLTAVVALTAVTLFAAGVFDGGGDASATTTGKTTGICAKDTPDCEDAILGTDDGGDNGDGASVAPACANNVPDCNETVVEDDSSADSADDEGGVNIAPMCAADVPDCVDMIVDDSAHTGGAEPTMDPAAP